MAVLSLSRGLTLNAQQLIGFAKLVDEFALPADPGKIGTPYAGMAKLFDIDEVRFAKVIGEENWPKLKQQLDMMKAAFGVAEDG